MNTKHYLIVSGIVGGVIGSLLTALLVSPVTAQRDKFGVIECTELRIIDQAGTKLAELGSVDKGGYVTLRGKDGKSAVFLSVNKNGGHVFARGSDGESSVFLQGLNKSGTGGTVSVQNNVGETTVMLTSGNHGGTVSAHAKDRQSSAVLGINKRGAYLHAKSGNDVSTWDKNGYRQSTVK